MKRLILHLFILSIPLVFLSGCHSIFGVFDLNQSVIIKKGDTLYSIARLYHVDLQELIDENNLNYPYILSIGQKIYLPNPATYKVQKGDTLYAIAKEKETTVAALIKANRLKKPYTLQINQELVIRYEGDGMAATKPKKQVYDDKTPVGKLTIAPTVQSKVVGKARASSHVPWTQSKKRFLTPVKGRIISSFGANKTGKINDGINIAANKGAQIKAAESGTIGYADDSIKAYGNLVIIRHSGGWMTAYAHADSLLVKKGQKVKKGQVIATVGQTGNVKSPQLHFEIRYNTKVVNPKNYLQ